jgi:hypothetical protein
VASPCAPAPRLAQCYVTELRRKQHHDQVIHHIIGRFETKRDLMLGKGVLYAPATTCHRA